MFSICVQKAIKVLLLGAFCPICNKSETKSYKSAIYLSVKFLTLHRNPRELEINIKNINNNFLIINPKQKGMKKAFTLIAGMLLVSSLTFAQKKWTNIVVQGDMEGEMPAYTTIDEMFVDGQAVEGATWNSFWCHEFPQNEIGEEQFQGTATIVEDPLNASNHCARVIARSEAIADSCENKVAADGKLASWDCQFFIFATEPIPEGKLVKMTLSVRAEKAGSFETQAHWGPGDYNHWQMFGNVNVTTEWQTIEVETQVVADQVKAGDGKAFQSVAFNLSTNTAGNVFYFDDVKLEIKDESDKPETEDFINFLRKGTLTDDQVFDNFSTFTGRMGKTNADEKAVVVNDPKDGQPALTVQTIAWNAEVALKDSLGNDSIDQDTGEPVFAKYVINEAGDTILGGSYGSFDDWRTQFFVSVNHKFKAGEPIKFKMAVRAERVDGEALEDPISLDTQVHTTPGGYIHWSFVGSINDINEEWQEFEFGYDDENPQTIPSEGKGGQTIAFNCNKNKDVAVNIYFRFEELAFNEGKVEDNERVLASSDAVFSVGTNQDGIGEGKLDLTEAMKVLEIDNFDSYIDNAKMKVQALDPETEDVKYEDVDLTAGAFVNAAGYWQESDANSIILEIDEDNTGNGILAFITTNNGVTVDAKGIATKFAFEKDGWRYLFNVTMLDPDAYERYLGISEVNVAPKANVIYDLMGRQLTKTGKGLYIINGKKVLMK